MIARFVSVLTCISVFFLCSSLPSAAQKLNPIKSEIRAFLKADTNRDRVLTIKEFKGFVKLMAAVGQSTAKTIRFFGAYNYAFSVVDKNKDGILTPMEMRSADNNFRTKK